MSLRALAPWLVVGGVSLAAAGGALLLFHEPKGSARCAASAAPPEGDRIEADASRGRPEAEPRREASEAEAVDARPRGGPLLGSLLCPDWMPVEDLRVRLQDLDRREQVHAGQVRRHQGRCLLSFPPVPVGTYDLEFRTRQFPDAFFIVTALELRADDPRPHPRLQDLDLHDTLFRFEIHARDEAGERPALSRPLLARVPRPDGGIGHVGFQWFAGQAVVHGPSSRLEFLVLEPGFLCEATDLDHGRCELLLRRAPRTVLHLPGLHALVDGIPAYLAITPTDAGLPDSLQVWDRDSEQFDLWYRSSRWIGGPLRTNDTAQLPAMGPGRYRLRLTLGRRAGRGRSATVDLGALTLAGGARERRIRLRLDHDEAAVRRGLRVLADDEDGGP